MMESILQIVYALHCGKDKHHYQNGRGSESLI